MGSVLLIHFHHFTQSNATHENCTRALPDYSYSGVPAKLTIVTTLCIDAHQMEWYCIRTLQITRTAYTPLFVPKPSACMPLITVMTCVHCQI